MKNISDLTQSLPLFKCLGSDIRIAILVLLSENGPMAMRDIADRLGITAGSLSPHIKLLSDNELISIKFDPGKHGIQRICSIFEDKIIIDFEAAINNKNIYSYSSYSCY